MGILSAIGSITFSDCFTFGRSKTRIFAVVAAETIFLGVTVFVSKPPFTPIPFGGAVILFITGILSAVFATALYALLSGLGYRTYSITFHSPAHILKCWGAYLILSTVVIYVGYLLFVYPYSESLIPKTVDIGIGAVLSTVFAISIASISYGEDFFTDNTNSKSEDIDCFITAAQDLKEKPESDIIDEADRLIESGESLLTGLQDSDLEGTEDLASDLEDWLETFKQRDLQGQKKMVGDLPKSSTQFTVWEDRFDVFQNIQEELEKMANSAMRKVLLSIRGK